MTSNIEKCKKVIAEGEKILLERIRSTDRLYYNKITTEYPMWYSKGLKLIQQFLQTSEADFKRHGDIIQDNLTNIYLYNSPHPVDEEKLFIIALSFELQLGFIQAVKDKLERPSLDIERTVLADLFDTELEQARELNEKGYTQAAGIIAGVKLEKHLLHICIDRGCIKKREKSDIKSSAQLLRDKEVINFETFRKIEFLNDIRNNCRHKADVEKKSVQKLIEGVQKIIKTIPQV